MTDKQRSILDSALELFSTKGYDAVPTSQIAKAAGVSEGLIFRHFQNKLGLLNAIMQMGKEKVEEGLGSIIAIEDAGGRIQAIMESPFNLEESDYPFWRLLYSLKWQNEYYDDSIAEPIRDILVSSLKELKYPDPENEANLIMSYVDGFATTILLKSEVIDKDQLLQSLRKNYK